MSLLHRHRLRQGDRHQVDVRGVVVVNWNCSGWNHCNLEIVDVDLCLDRCRRQDLRRRRRQVGRLQMAGS